MKAVHTNAYRIRGLLMAPPFLFLTLVLFGETEKAWVIWPAGLAVFSIGVLIRIWAQMHLHYRLRVHKILTRTGPYAYVRNPIYIANTIMLLGVTILSELLWFLPLMLLWCAVVYNFVVRCEEAHLLEKYGDTYAAFLRETPRWLPRFGSHPVASPHPKGKSFLLESIVAELHCGLWLIPMAGKEIVTHMESFGF